MKYAGPQPEEEICQWISVWVVFVVWEWLTRFVNQLIYLWWSCDTSPMAAMLDNFGQLPLLRHATTIEIKKMKRWEQYRKVSPCVAMCCPWPNDSNRTLDKPCRRTLVSKVDCVLAAFWHSFICGHLQRQGRSESKKSKIEWENHEKSAVFVLTGRALWVKLCEDLPAWVRTVSNCQICSWWGVGCPPVLEMVPWHRESESEIKGNRNKKELVKRIQKEH